MSVGGQDFRLTWLWRQAFVEPRSDCETEEQEFFRTQYLSIRERTAQLLSRPLDAQERNVQDLHQSDVLWAATSSLAEEGSIDVNPPEAFVLGASILVRHLEMSVEPHSGGLTEVRPILIQDAELRRVYGATINHLASSLRWSLQTLEQAFSENRGALANRTRSSVDLVKLACLLRVADAFARHGRSESA